MVLGQLNFTNGSANQGGSAAANTLSNPADIFVDGGGRLWVADTGNNRVLRFDLASLLTNDAPASRVFGQPDFVTVTPNVTQAKMSGPSGVFVDAVSALWVADTANNRVLRFDNIVLASNGANASGVLGQLTFITAATGTTALGMNSPTSVTVNSAGALWVADNANNRVLRFDAAAGKLDGAAADRVLGQPDFTTVATGLSATAMSAPYGVFIDNSTGNLWVGDYANRRVLRFSTAATLSSGAAATLVLGQPDFTSNTLVTTVQGGGGIRHIADGPAGSLLVADFDNNRVLRYTPVFVPPAPQPPLISLRGSAKRTTTSSKLIVSGLSGDDDGTVVAVKGNVNSGSYTNAKGISPWHYTARRLKHGTNRIKIRAIDNTGLKSQFVRVTITRK
jgi:sugar lactone lactonase YvrE